MKYRLICLDIDGTLINSKYEIGERTKRALQLAQAQGYIVTLVTGRRFLSTVKYSRELELDLPIICNNGGLIAASNTGKPFHICTIPGEHAQRIFSVWTEYEVPVFAYRHTLTPPDIYSQNPGDHSRIKSYLDREGENIRVVPDIRTAFTWEPLKIITYGHRHTEKCYYETRELYRNAPLHSFLTDYEGVAYLEIYPQQATKANGLRWLCNYYGINREQIIAFGDNLNDLDMLEWAGLGVAMGNALPEVKAMADKVTADRDEDGIAQTLEDVLGLG